MVFTSHPLYLDPPNWNQQSHHHHHQAGGGGGGGGNELQPPIQATPVSAVTGGTARPTSMVDRARMAKIPQPELALKCPRCDSTNTKFCYFNNYSLSQPRHFCKTCRRYWTRGGALRSVPVGGGCRRNKRSKSSGSKSNSSAANNNNNNNADRQAGGGASSSSSSTATSGSSVMPSSFHSHHQLPFLTPLHALSEYGMPNLGLNFARMQQIDHAVNYQIGSGPGIGLDQWRIQQLQQFPFLGELDNPSAAVMTMVPAAGGLYGNNPFDGDQSGTADGFNGEIVLPKATSSSLISQLASVKMEDSATNPHGISLNLARHYPGINSGNDQYWVGGGSTGGSWAPGDLAGFNSSSSGNIL